MNGNTTLLILVMKIEHVLCLRTKRIYIYIYINKFSFPRIHLPTNLVEEEVPFEPDFFG